MPTPEQQTLASTDALQETQTGTLNIGNLRQATQDRVMGGLERINNFATVSRNVIEFIRSLLRGRGSANGLRGLGDRLRQNQNPRATVDNMTPEVAFQRISSLNVLGQPAPLAAEMRVTNAQDLLPALRRLSVTSDAPDGGVEMGNRVGDWVTRMERAASALGAEFANIANPEERALWTAGLSGGRVSYVCDGIRVWAELRNESGQIIRSALATGSQVLFKNGPRGEPGRIANGSESAPITVYTASGAEVAWSVTGSGSNFRTADRRVYERVNGNTLIEVGYPPSAVAYYGEGTGNQRSMIVRVNAPGNVIPSSSRIDSQLLPAGAQGTFLRMPNGTTIGPPSTIAPAARPNESAAQKRQAIDAFVDRLAALPMEDVVAYLSSAFPGGSENERIFALHVGWRQSMSLGFTPGNNPLIDSVRNNSISCQQLGVLFARIAARKGIRSVSLEMYTVSGAGPNDPNAGHVACVYLVPPNGGPPCRAITLDAFGIHDDNEIGTGATALEAATNALKNTWDTSPGHDARPANPRVFTDAAPVNLPGEPREQDTAGIRAAARSYEEIAAELIGVRQQQPAGRPRR